MCIRDRGLGEEGKYHVKGDGNPLPEKTRLTYALVGNQNCGKTTLFNQLTGSNQHIGNFPGVTVDRKDGPIKGYPVSYTHLDVYKRQLYHRSIKGLHGLRSELPIQNVFSERLAAARASAMAFRE